MALEDVIEDIERQANVTAQAILKEAGEEAERTVSKARKESEKQVFQFEEETERMLAEKKNAELLAAKIEQKRMLLATRKMAAEKIFNEIKDSLSKFGEKERESIVKILVERARQELQDAKYIYSNKADKKFAEKSGLVFADAINCIGGIIVENSDKTVRINLTFDRLFENFKGDINVAIAKNFE
ncbi:MAG: hypothetical protein HYT70_01890 [Candidatus Aenigmarchaeota archaeon]|nr:hypothetical protein [Candidatus Aenigmarchaeota archaeon]